MFEVELSLSESTQVTIAEARKPYFRVFFPFSRLEMPHSYRRSRGGLPDLEPALRFVSSDTRRNSHPFCDISASICDRFASGCDTFASICDRFACVRYATQFRLTSDRLRFFDCAKSCGCVKKSASPRTNVRGEFPRADPHSTATTETETNTATPNTSPPNPPRRVADSVMSSRANAVMQQPRLGPQPIK